MAVSLDRAMTTEPVTSAILSIGMPPRQRLDMPNQDLRKAPRGVARVRASARVIGARFVAFGGAAALAIFGTREMIKVVSSGGVTVLEGIMTALFALTFSWIALSATTTIAGVLFPPARHVRVKQPGGKLKSLTALVMPIYHEDAARTTASLQAMAEDVQAAGEAGAFEIVILSDSNDPDSWVCETLAVDRLSRALAGIMPVWYRRRWLNTAKKAGNIKDFVEKWGARYDTMIVLDADSLMSAEALVTLAAAMEADPQLGILQTIPILSGGESLFGRLQQFAGRVYGPIVARGLAAWQGSDGNYWGHNAAIRTRAFAEACGLPELRGKKPFGGPIMSHDFVEAALMRRAGWRVEMTSRLGGSWEESPPSLIDVAVRDRRWAQGNIQHAKVIGTRGLAPASRIHFAIGIMSYMSAPLWLLLILAGFALSAQAHFIRPEYFTKAFQLFPSWPRFDSERMVKLFILTMVILFLPKVFGLVRALYRGDLRRGCGGALRLIASFVTEVITSALFAPTMMAIHSRQIYEIFLGVDAGWAAQRRNAGETSWRDAWRRHRWHTALGVVAALAAYNLSPAIVAWLSPTILGLVLSAPLSRASGSKRVGEGLRRAGLLVTPEEGAPHPLALRRDEITAESSLPPEPFVALVTDASVRAVHFSRASSPPHMRGVPDPHFLAAQSKIREAGTLPEALSWLNTAERLRAAGNRFLIERLADLPRDEKRHSSQAVRLDQDDMAIAAE